MKWLRFLGGVALIPVCAAATMGLVSTVAWLGQNDGRLAPPGALAALAGMAVWLAVYHLLPLPIRAYVLAHELTHALWASAMGAEVSELRVSSRGGSVTLSDSNFLVTLAPYFFPLYTALVVLAHHVLGLFVDVRRWDMPWLALVGFTWSFHFTFTVHALLVRQSDIRECGRLFSYGLIYLMNVLVLGLGIVIVSAATLDGFAEAVWDGLTVVWAALAASAGETAAAIKMHVAR